MSTSSDKRAPSLAQTVVPLVIVAIVVGAAVAAYLAGISKAGVAYHAIVFVTFFVLYTLMPRGFKAHFNVPDATKNKHVSTADILYYTTVVHTTTCFGDIYPVTLYGRSVVTAHVMCVFLGLAGLVPILKT